ncbi:uncharacterized protein LOC112519840 [Cynara cardunculus var. scolymus]|uniref:Uncharacterized protein n=1 Tax=Cynara cardunculus var. scolymus TaxID=59895 RepID=A0A103Y1V0_CYNCS|nr:uncharacterized protein LOC112519840 [Cynara cardunculus var. scolymus]KVI00983.1 hypothetical protein Ccrd_020755 [Cynara cardunculus var. scolymus]
MADDHHRQNPPNKPRVSGEIGDSSSRYKPNFPNPPEITNPDAATLRDQWKYAIRQYSKWYSHAWGTAILAGLSFFALGWVIKGGNPIPSFHQSDVAPRDSPPRPSDPPDVNQSR